MESDATLSGTVTEAAAGRVAERSERRQFVLTGFRTEGVYRVFGFRGIAADRSESMYAVRTDLALAHKHGIRLQELPLLCRGVLERMAVGEERVAFTYTEEEMHQRATHLAEVKEAADQKKKPPKRPAGNNAGAAWRGPARP
ncbi:MAG: hypothetical protein HY820_31740 [Acidobacteria bacterium]|nr:hypothetical protein [Acidobacteriota bacterium]